MMSDAKRKRIEKARDSAIKANQPRMVGGPVPGPENTDPCRELH